jgi:hypothetical protein
MDGYELASILAKRLRERGHEVTDPSQVQGLAEVVSEITTAIRKTDIMVAIVTSRNPNLMFELGMARGANRTLLVAARDASDLPFDLTSVPYVSLGGVAEEDAVTIERRMEDLRPLQAPDPFLGDTSFETLRTIAEQPELTTLISPIEFERLIQEYFTGSGFDVTLAARQSGYDFEISVQGVGAYARQSLIVETKRTQPNSRVSVDSVLKLAGAVEATRAARGLLITTSDFTASARGLAERLPVSLWTLSEVLAAPARALIEETAKQLRIPSF